MDEAIVPLRRPSGSPQLNPCERLEIDMTKIKTSTFDTIYRLAEVATIAFMLSALPVAAVSLIAQSA
jgi:hypothetical protein